MFRIDPLQKWLAAYEDSILPLDDRTFTKDTVLELQKKTA